MKACKIIATAFNPTRIVKSAQPWPHHGQILNTRATYVRMVYKLVELEETYDPGMRVDTFVMVYKDKEGVYKEWAQFNGIKTPGGRLKVVFVGTDSGCYHLYNKGFQINKKKYDWFLFTCDDVCVFGDQYYKRIKDKWKKGYGYIGLQGVTEDHVQGSIGLTKRSVLNAVCKVNKGVLPHPKGKWQQERNIHEGEIPFTEKIQALGFKLVPFNDSTTWDKANLCYPYHNLLYGS